MPDPDPLLIEFDVARNDDNGYPTASAERLELGWRSETILDLATTSRRPPRFVELGGRFRIGRRLYPFLRSRSCVGNLLWDAFTIEVGVAARLIAALAGSGQWTCDGGWTAVTDACWRDKAPPDQVERILREECRYDG